jgi:mycofactocin precursor
MLRSRRCLGRPPSVVAVGEICPTAVSIAHPAGGPVSNQPTIAIDPAIPAAATADPTIEVPAVEPDGEPMAEKLVEETLVEEVSIDGMCGVY